MKIRLINKEISWLSFNARVLQEAADPTVPLIERVRFLGIFSSNLDEFFRVRVATLRRLDALGKKAVKLIGDNPADVLKRIHEIVISQQADFDAIYRDILKQLQTENIFMVNERELMPDHAAYVRDYFQQKVRTWLIPLMIDQIDEFPNLKDNSIYLAIRMRIRKNPKKYKFALIEVPTDVLPRFVVLPEIDKKKYIILLDDVIRFCLGDVFSLFEYDQFEAYTIKLTRDAELELDNDIAESLVRKVAKSLAKRKMGIPVRFLYDYRIPDDLLKFIVSRLRDQKHFMDKPIPGGRYHNFRDFIHFPNLGPRHLTYKAAPPLPHREFKNSSGILNTLLKKDVLLHYPYQTFDVVIDFLREAAIDPGVTSIKMTLYRVAQQSNVINALLNAARNGKSVTVVMELQARFDEEANIQWSTKLQEEGIRVIHSTRDVKVHAKLILIRRKMKQKDVWYANIATGNFNESTARVYSDLSLFTCNPKITGDVRKVFDALETNFSVGKYKHLMVSPFNTRSVLGKLIRAEIKNAQKGKAAYILAKVNHVTDPKIIKRLYEAAAAGVKIRLMVRGMMCLHPDQKEFGTNLQVKATIDRYLEHARVMIFCHGGTERMYLSSADWMPRNFDSRVEVGVAIYDETVREEIRSFLEAHWRDNVKSRLIGKRPDGESPKGSRAQEAIYEMLKKQVQNAS